jgi:hypothetical protein
VYFQAQFSTSSWQLPKKPAVEILPRSSERKEKQQLTTENAPNFLPDQLSYPRTIYGFPRKTIAKDESDVRSAQLCRPTGLQCRPGLSMVLSTLYTSDLCFQPSTQRVWLQSHPRRSSSDSHAENRQCAHLSTRQIAKTRKMTIGIQLL